MRNLTRFKEQPLRIYWEQSCPTESWHQACLSINKTGIGIRRASDKIIAAYIGSISQSATLVELTTGQSPIADHTFTKMIDETNALSLSLPKSGAGLSAAAIRVLGLHPLPNEFRAAVKYRLGTPIYEKERKCPYCKTGSLDTLGDHAVACHERGDMISLLHVMGGAKFFPLAALPTCHHFASRKTLYQKQILDLEMCI